MLRHEQRIEKAVSAAAIQRGPFHVPFLLDDGGRRLLRSLAVALQKQIMPAHDGARAISRPKPVDDHRSTTLLSRVHSGIQEGQTRLKYTIIDAANLHRDEPQADTTGPRLFQQPIQCRIDFAP